MTPIEVVLHNDHYSTNELVRAVLMTVFGVRREDALALVALVRRSGRGVVGPYKWSATTNNIAWPECIAAKRGCPLLLTLQAVGANREQG